MGAENTNLLNADNPIQVNGGDSLVDFKDKNWGSLAEAKKDIYNTVYGALINLDKQSKQKIKELVDSGALKPKIANPGMPIGALGGNANPAFPKSNGGANTANTSSANGSASGTGDYANLGNGTQAAVDNMNNLKIKNAATSYTGNDDKGKAANGAGAYTTSAGMIDRKQYLVQPDEYDGQGGGDADPDPDPQNVKSVDKKDTASGTKKTEQTPAVKQENTNTTQTPNAAPPARKKDIDLSDKVSWISQAPDWKNCEKTCEKMITNIKDAKYKVKPGGSANAIQIAAETPKTHDKISPTVGFDKGIEYLDSELDKGHAVVTGVNHTLNYAKTKDAKDDGSVNDPKGTPATTDHYVVIYGRGYDEDKKQYYYLFYDPGTKYEEKGADKENKLYLDETNKTLTGKSAIHDKDDKVYTASQFRPNVTN